MNFYIFRMTQAPVTLTFGIWKKNINEIILFIKYSYWFSEKSKSSWFYSNFERKFEKNMAAVTLTFDISKRGPPLGINSGPT
jgi:hypothetical protein